MKTHDHPGMSIVNYMIKGRMRATLFTHLQDDIYARKVQILEEGRFAFVEGMTTNFENLH
jgi:redox-sensitive bicupin YhaK (pirin superfamily)